MRITLLFLGLAVGVQAQDVVPDKVGKRIASNFKRLIAKKGMTEEKKVALIKDMEKFPHQETAKVLAPYLAKDTLAVRITTARVLVKYKDVKSVGKALLLAFKSQRNDGEAWRGMKITLLRAVGDIEYVQGVGIVNTHISSEQEWIAKAAIVAAAKLRQKSSIDALIKELRNLEGDGGNKMVRPEADIFDPLSEEMLGTNPSTDPLDVIKHHDRKEEAPKNRREALEKAVHEALYILTGIRLKNAQKWETWWRNAKKQFQVPKPKKPRRRKK